MLKKKYESKKEENKASISSDKSLIDINFKTNSFNEDKIESINEFNLNRNIINEKDNNITSFIKRIQFKTNAVILLFFEVILQTIQIVSNVNKFQSTKLKLSHIVLKIRRIEYKNNKSFFSFIIKNTFYNEYYLNDNFQKLRQNIFHKKYIIFIFIITEKN